MAGQNQSPEPLPRSRAEMVQRLVGLSYQHDQEDMEYWRHATEEQRGRTLYNLLKLVDAIGRYPPKTEVFPGFPKSKQERHQE